MRFTHHKASSRGISAADENVPDKSMEPEAEEEEEEEGEEDKPKKTQPPLTLKIPAQNVGSAVQEGEVPDPNEPRYCFCNQVSYGEMIACDNPTCEREWVRVQSSCQAARVVLSMSLNCAVPPGLRRPRKGAEGEVVLSRLCRARQAAQGEEESAIAEGWGGVVSLRIFVPLYAVVTCYGVMDFVQHGYVYCYILKL